LDARQAVHYGKRRVSSIAAVVAARHDAKGNWVPTEAGVSNSRRIRASSNNKLNRLSNKLNKLNNKTGSI